GVFICDGCGMLPRDLPTRLPPHFAAVGGPDHCSIVDGGRGPLQARVAPRSSRQIDLSRRRSDGSPRRESGKPARHMRTIVFILAAEALAGRGVLIGNVEKVKKEPDQRAVAEETPVRE